MCDLCSTIISCEQRPNRSYMFVILVVIINFVFGRLSLSKEKLFDLLCYSIVIYWAFGPEFVVGRSCWFVSSIVRLMRASFNFNTLPS